jgi:hypothetical protein
VSLQRSISPPYWSMQKGIADAGCETERRVAEWSAREAHMTSAVSLDRCWLRGCGGTTPIPDYCVRSKPDGLLNEMNGWRPGRGELGVGGGELRGRMEGREDGLDSTRLGGRNRPSTSHGVFSSAKERQQNWQSISIAIPAPSAPGRAGGVRGAVVAGRTPIAQSRFWIVGGLQERKILLQGGLVRPANEARGTPAQC